MFKKATIFNLLISFTCGAFSGVCYAHANPFLAPPGITDMASDSPHQEDADYMTRRDLLFRRGPLELAEHSLTAAALLAFMNKLACTNGPILRQKEEWEIALDSLRNKRPSQTITVHGNIKIGIFDKHDNSDFWFTTEEIEIIKDTLEQTPPHAVHVRHIFSLHESIRLQKDRDLAGFALPGRDEFVLYMHDDPPAHLKASNKNARFISGPEGFKGISGKAKLDAEDKFINTRQFLALTVVHENAHLGKRVYAQNWIDLHERSGDDLDNYALSYGMLTDDMTEEMKKNWWKEDKATIYECLAGNGINLIDRALENARNGKLILLEKILLAFAESFIIPGNNTDSPATLRAYILRGFGFDHLQTLDLPINITDDGWIELGDLFRFQLDPDEKRIIGFQRTERYADLKHIVDEYTFEQLIKAPFIDAVFESKPTFNPAAPTHEVFKISEEFTKYSDLIDAYPELKNINLPFPQAFSFGSDDPLLETFLYPNFPVFPVVKHEGSIAVSIRAVYSSYQQNGIGITPHTPDPIFIHSALWFKRNADEEPIVFDELNPGPIKGQIKRMALDSQGNLLIDFFDKERTAIEQFDEMPVDPIRFGLPSLAPLIGSTILSSQ